MRDLLRDQFKHPDGTNLASLVPDFSWLSGVWSLNLSGTANVQSNRANVVSVSGDVGFLAELEFGYPDYMASCIVNAMAVDPCVAGLGVRISSATGLLQYFVNVSRVGSLNIWQWDGATATLLATQAVTIDPSTDYVITAKVQGSTISAMLDGANIVIAENCTQNPTSSLVGIRSSAAGTRFDDFAVTGVSRRQVICDGDSLTFGTGSTSGQNYPYQLEQLLPIAGDYVCFNLGISGTTIATMISGAVARVDKRICGWNTKNIVVCWGGINDLANGDDATTVYNNIVTYCQARQVAGWQVVVCTFPASSALTVGQEVNRQTVNTNIRNNYTTFADALADLAANSHFDEQSDVADATYYADETHLKNAGYAIVAGLINTAIGTLS